MIANQHFVCYNVRRNSKHRREIILFQTQDNQNCFAVLDTETNWRDKVMSIGVVIAEEVAFRPVEKRYYILTPESRSGGMYSHVLHVSGVETDLQDTRKNVLRHLVSVLEEYRVKSIFAYNAKFDYQHLPELQAYDWFDIMRIAAYRQYNRFIPQEADCCGTGRLKRNYGVEPIMRMVSGSHTYCEVHNALCDAVDELEIMRLLGHPTDVYKQLNPV